MRTAEALYSLHIDAFLEGIADAPQPRYFGLDEPAARAVRKERFADRIRAQREKKVA